MLHTALLPDGMFSTSKKTKEIEIMGRRNSGHGNSDHVKAKGISEPHPQEFRGRGWSLAPAHGLVLHDSPYRRTSPHARRLIADVGNLMVMSAIPQILARRTAVPKCTHSPSWMRWLKPSSGIWPAEREKPSNLTKLVSCPGHKMLV